MVEVAAIVLAAGRASRFTDGPSTDGIDSKVVALLQGRPLVTHVAANAIASPTRPVIAVTGRGATQVAAALAGLDVALVHNSAYAEGMAGSIATGLAAVPATADAVLILLADMPRVAPATLAALIEAFAHERPDAVVPTYEGQRGNPVLIARALFPALLALRGDVGARRILADETCRVVPCPVDDPGILVDVDTREALAALGTVLDTLPSRA